MSSSKAIENIGWSRRLRVYGYAGACMLATSCTGEILPSGPPIVEDTQLSLAAEPSAEEFTLPGYPNAIKIQRDANGTPHISARTESEGYGGLCYAIAKDRLFQLDFLRRVGQGRLAELFGSGPDGSVLQGDRLARVINIPKLARNRYSELSPASKELMQACSAAINLVITRAIETDTLPLEFADLAYQPDTWRDEDSLAISIGVAMNLDTGIYLTKIQYSAIAAIIGPDAAATLIPPPPALSMFDAQGKLNPPKQFVTGPGRGGGKKPGKIIKSPRLRRGWRAPERRSTGLGEGAGPESNNYAVDGRRTKTGRPLVANDPHLPLTTPSLAYTAQLKVESNINGKPMNVQGVTFPGFPTFVSARTDKTSWAVTFMLLDDVDLYAEEIRDAASGKEVLINGAWVPVQTRAEQILVAGESPVTITVSETPHGPVLNAAFPALDAFGPVALKSTTAQSAWSIEGLINLPRTNNWADFRASARTSGIGFNFLFSDETGQSGRIGYQASGLVPLRNSLDNAFVVVPGNDGAHEWTGYADRNLLPSVYDPASHALATGNNRIVPDDYAPQGQPIYLSNYYDTPWRAQRLYTRLLQGSDAFNISDFASIQLDTTSVVNLPLRDTFVAALNRAGLPGSDPSAAAAFNALKKWNGKADATSQGAAVYETLLFVLLRNTVIGAIGAELYAGYASSVFITQQQQALRDLLETPRAPYFGATGPGDAATARDAAVSVALGEADALLRGALGADVSKWTWGAVHTLTYNHPLAGIDPRFDLGTFPANGDASTPWIGGFFLHAGVLAQAGGLPAAFAQDALQVVRVVWEPSSKKRSLGTLSTGQSGDPRSPHYADQAAPWRSGKYLQIPYFQ